MTFQPPTRPDHPALPSGLSAMADRYDVLLCDLWGVVHDGRAAFGPTIEALRRFRQKGGTVVFITNAPRPQAPVLVQLSELGVPPDAFDGIVTSGDVTIDSIVAHGPAAAYHIGPPRDLALFEAAQARSGVAPRLASLDTADYVVVTGLFDDTRETPADYAASLAVMRRRGLTMVCANPDIVVHVGDQLIYCGGALAEAYEQVGGRTVQAGKPYAPIYEAALRVAAERRGTPIDRARVLAVGDGMRTDVAGAAGQGLDVLFVTSGIHRDVLHPEPIVELDPEAYLARLARLAHRPLAAIPHLVW